MIAVKPKDGKPGREQLQAMLLKEQRVWQARMNNARDRLQRTRQIEVEPTKGLRRATSRETIDLSGPDEEEESVLDQNSPVHKTMETMAIESIELEPMDEDKHELIENMDNPLVEPYDPEHPHFTPRNDTEAMMAYGIKQMTIEVGMGEEITKERQARQENEHNWRTKYRIPKTEPSKFESVPEEIEKKIGALFRTGNKPKDIETRVNLANARKEERIKRTDTPARSKQIALEIGGLRSCQKHLDSACKAKKKQMMEDEIRSLKIRHKQEQLMKEAPELDRRELKRQKRERERIRMKKLEDQLAKKEKESEELLLKVRKLEQEKSNPGRYDRYELNRRRSSRKRRDSSRIDQHEKRKKETEHTRKPNGLETDLSKEKTLNACPIPMEIEINNENVKIESLNWSYSVENEFDFINNLAKEPSAYPHISGLHLMTPCCFLHNKGHQLCQTPPVYSFIFSNGRHPFREAPYAHWNVPTLLHALMVEWLSRHYRIFEVGQLSWILQMNPNQLLE